MQRIDKIPVGATVKKLTKDIVETPITISTSFELGVLDRLAKIEERLKILENE